MFELLLEKMSQVQNKLHSIEREVSALDSSQTIMQKENSKVAKKVKRVRGEINNMGEMMIDLVQVAAKTEQDLSLLTDRVEKLDARQLKGSFILRGVPVEENEITKDVVIEFMKTKLEIREQDIPKIHTAYRFGRGSHRPISFRLVDANKTQVIFKHAPRLKGKHNDIETLSLLMSSSQRRKPKEVRGKGEFAKKIRLCLFHIKWTSSLSRERW